MLYHKKNLFGTMTLHNIFFFIDSLTIFTTQMVDFETYSRIILLLVVIAQQ